ncbi:hypothetical protein HMPREF3200_01713 [Anaerococcus tetradius]|uniref:Uncharacterized protein n=1 Tax=Anaerococcus tetradius TaxID=33036 RepID=A0A133KB65_9FIRM|nr:hypothetical protein HMPREF3200_01713 [Anaerococcus tetradius]
MISKGVSGESLEGASAAPLGCPLEYEGSNPSKKFSIISKT